MLVGEAQSDILVLEPVFGEVEALSVDGEEAGWVVVARVVELTLVDGEEAGWVVDGRGVVLTVGDDTIFVTVPGKLRGRR